MRLKRNFLAGLVMLFTMTFSQVSFIMYYQLPISSSSKEVIYAIKQDLTGQAIKPIPSVSGYFGINFIGLIRTIYFLRIHYTVSQPLFDGTCFFYQYHRIFSLPLFIFQGTLRI
jgi:hypothetical protein